MQALADGLKAQVTNGMDPANAALVYVAVESCKCSCSSQRNLPANRQANATSNTVALSVTVSPLVQSAAQVEQATRAVYQAVTGNPPESLPQGASLDTALQIMNKDLQQ